MTSVIDRQVGEQLLLLSRHALISCVEDDETVEPERKVLSPALLEQASTFVTLTNHCTLRGCIGSTQGRLPLILDVARNTVAAANDPRFDPVTTNELDDIQIEVSVLERPRRMAFVDYDDLVSRLQPGADGVILSWQDHKALLLPQVWERLPQPDRFLDALCRKGRIPRQALYTEPPCVVVATFKVACFSEAD